MASIPVDYGILIDETQLMENTRRRQEQYGHHWHTKAKVHARERPEEEYRSVGPEGELQNDILQHPLLDGQQYDGAADLPLSSLPYLNPDAKTKYENARREQELQHQMRLGLMPKMGTAPKPER
jgi:hypothetical protein